MKNLSLLFIAFLLLQLNTFAQDGWFEQTSGTTTKLNSVYFVDDNNGFIVGDNGTFLKTTDAGENWIYRSTGTNENLRSVHFLNTDIGFAVGKYNDTSWVIKTTDGGENWIPQAVNPTYPFLGIRTIQFIDSNTGWTAGWQTSTGFPHPVLYKTTDGGSNWINKTLPFLPQISYLNSLHFTDSNNGWVVGGADYDSTGVLPILKTTDGGDSWIDQTMHLFNGDGELTSVFLINDTTGFVVGWLSSQVSGTYCLFKTTDGGANWIQKALPVNFMSLLHSIYFIDGNTGWTVGGSSASSFAGILRTTNGGEEWMEQGNDPLIILNDLFFIDENNGWTVGDSGLILYTVNGGVSFVEENKIDELPTEYYLSHNYPNPFNPSTKIKFTVPSAASDYNQSKVTLKVFDVLGNEVATLVDEYKPAGRYEVEFNASKISSSVSAKGGYPSGVYFYQLQAGNFVETKKMLLLK